MQTMISVPAPSSVTIRATRPLDTKPAIARYQQAWIPALGTHWLEPGIYMIRSEHPVEISINDVTVVTFSGGKDDWPSPRAQTIALEPGATESSLRDYFQIAKDVSPHG